MIRPKFYVFRLTFFLMAITLGVSISCTTIPPSNIDQVCTLFDDRYDWYLAAKRVEKKWGSPAHVTMAIMHQESSFRADAKPPRKKLFGIIPGPRPSTAFGYAQAINPTWEEYKRSTKQPGADRDDFDDAMDFVGWYNHRSRKRNRIAPHDARRLYLAYHEGHGGYARGSYNKKPWLIKVAKKVERQSHRYKQQLATCQADLEKWNLRRWLSAVF